MSNVPVRAPASGLPSFTLDDATAHVSQLAQLLDVTVDIVLGMRHVLKDGSRNTHLDQVDALLSVGRDLANRIVSDLQRSTT